MRLIDAAGGDVEIWDQREKGEEEGETGVLR
jgi:hypothetical protein